MSAVGRLAEGVGLFAQMQHAEDFTYEQQHAEFCDHAWQFLRPAVKAAHYTRKQFTGEAVPVEHRRSDCDSPNLFRCRLCSLMVPFACGTRDEDKCSKCEKRYRSRVRFVARGPMKVAKPDSVVLLTVTAPGAKRHCRTHLHTHKDGVARPSVKCVEDGRDHDWCPCGEEGQRLEGFDSIALWNEGLGKGFNRLLTDLRRGSLLDGGRGDFQGAEYFRANEAQERGALHVHVLMRTPRAVVVDDDLMTWLRALVVHHGFGHEVDVQIIGQGGLDHVKAARYVAKYVTKTNATSSKVSMRKVVPCPLENPRDCKVADHVPPRRSRAWSTSRNWGLSLGVVVASQKMFAAGFIQESKEVLSVAMCVVTGGEMVEVT